jgi:hypothetical protein
MTTAVRAAGVADIDGGADDVLVPLILLIEVAVAEAQRQMSIRLVLLSSRCSLLLHAALSL